MSDVHGNPGPEPDPDREDEARRSEERKEGESGWEDAEEQETRPFKTTRGINIKGRDYAAGDTVYLTQEEYGVLEGLRAPLEGIEQEDDEEAQQSRHEEAIEAQKERLDKQREADQQASEKLASRQAEDEDAEIEEREALERALGSKRELLGGRGGVQGRVPGESDETVVRSQGRRPEGPRPPEGIAQAGPSAHERQRAFDQERQDRAQREDPARLDPTLGGTTKRKR